MKSPFPGMDPYLEQYWGDVHTSMATYARDQLQTQLPKELRARVEEYLTLKTENGDHRAHRRAPDVRIVENPRASATATIPKAGIAVAEPLVVRLFQEMPTQRSIKIIDSRSGGRLVTAIEILSPGNKVSRQGRKEYQQRQQDIIDAGANLVEIDFLRAGSYVLSAPESLLSEECLHHYRICVSRAPKVDEWEFYRISIRDSLPAIRIPLRETDADVLLDLQSIIEQVYENGAYDDLDYSKPPIPLLTDDDAVWADQLLREKGLR